ncbi:hypothetical protein PM001_09010 [[Clostridium] symbiosum]|nr:hypothetical protein [[Clostridium] symbiosum]MDB2036228.1 hypothetical protein [[Clostridium] symbiosum]
MTEIERTKEADTLGENPGRNLSRAENGRQKQVNHMGRIAPPQRKGETSL